jgi:hypothetical protein
LFVEINGIKGFIVNIDGFLRVGNQDPFRKHLVWSEVKDSNIDRIKVLPDFSQLLKKIKKFPFTVVSKLSIQHLNVILSKNSISIPANRIFTAAAGDDSQKSYSFAIPIAAARDSINLLSCDCVYLTAEYETIERALALHLGTMFYEYKTEDSAEKTEEYKSGPDFILEGIDEIDRVISKEVVGYLGEFYACSKNMRGMVTGYKHTTIYLNFLKIPHEALPSGTTIFATGRYFPYNDARFQKHPLSIKLVDSKQYPEKHLLTLAKIIKVGIEQVAKNYDLVTCVPPKPSQTKNRAKMILEYIPVIDKEFDKTKLAPNILKCTRDHTPQKKLYGYADRRENVKGAYAVSGDVKGKTVVLIDDIFTTGAILCEITDMLLQAGCARVYPLAIASTVTSKVSNGTVGLTCDKCGGNLCRRINKTDGDIFWGCANFKENNCKKTLRFEDGLELLNQQTGRKEPGPSFPDIDIPF